MVKDKDQICIPCTNRNLQKYPSHFNMEVYLRVGREPVAIGMCWEQERLIVSGYDQSP